MTREQRLEQALRHVEKALREGDPAITDTLWMTRDPKETCTMLDEVTMALEWPAAPSVEEGPRPVPMPASFGEFNVDPRPAPPSEAHARCPACDGEGGRYRTQELWESCRGCGGTGTKGGGKP